MAHQADCPECAAAVQIAAAEPGEIVDCPDCGVELEIVTANPVSLALAPEEAEDWGE